MFPKYKRLKTKDVLYLTKKKSFFGTEIFSFFYVDQYPNLKHNQISFHVSIKYNKHATARNLIKRAVIRQAKLLIEQGIIKKYYKIFIILNKHKIPILQKEFENINNKDIIAKIQKYFSKSFIALSKHLGNLSKE